MTEWGTKLLLTAVLAHSVYCISLCHILKAQHCCLSSNGCFNLPSAPNSPPPLSHPLTTYSDITGTEKTTGIIRKKLFRLAEF